MPPAGRCRLDICFREEQSLQDLTLHLSSFTFRFSCLSVLLAIANFDFLSFMYDLIDHPIN